MNLIGKTYKKKFKRRNLARLFKEKGFTRGVEIGVMHGTYSKTLCEENPDLKLYSVDPYMEVYGDPQTNEWGNKHLEEKYQFAKKRLEPFNCEMIRKTSLEAVRDFEPESIDFVYVDGAHTFDYAMVDIIEWGKIVKPGGIISGHDYCKSWPGVVRAVNAYAKEHNVDINLTDEITPSWFFERTWK